MRNKIDKYDKFIIIFFLLSFLFWIFCLSGCNGYIRIAKNPPKSEKDTVRLIERFFKTIPRDTGTLIKGKVILLPDSNEYWKNAAIIAGAKKQAATINLKTKYTDTCLSVFDRYEEGYNDGIDMGIAEGKSQCPQATKQVDTFERDRPQTLANLYLVESNLKHRDEELYHITANYNELKGDTRSFKWSLAHLFSFWQMWLIITLTGIVIFRKPLLGLIVPHIPKF